MDSGHHVHFVAQDRSYLAVLKKDIHAIALSTGLASGKIADIDLVVAEITSNLIKHARDGELLVKADPDGLEIIALDSGPGMSDVRRMSEDGVSTTNTLGHGLGAIRRLSDFCDIYSQKGWGTIILCRFNKNKAATSDLRKAEVRSIVISKPGETACGDGVAIVATAKKLKLLIGDGLGHGPDAQDVVTKAEAAFYASKEDNPVEIIRTIHTAVRKSRGLVATVAVYDYEVKAWYISGVGNISSWIGSLVAGKSVMPYNGIIGLSMPNSLGEHRAEHDYGQLLIMCSDGLRTRFDLQKYPGILKHDLSILATALYKDFGRRTDDTSVLIARITQKP